MILYLLLNVVIAVIGIVAVLYLLFRLFAWHQGDARFVIEARRRDPFTLKMMSQDKAVFETEVPFKNAGKQLGTIMDFFPRTLLPQEQYDKVVVRWPTKQQNGMTATGNRLSSIPVKQAASA